MKTRIVCIVLCSTSLHVKPAPFIDNSHRAPTVPGHQTFFVLHQPDLQITGGPLSVQARFRTGADGCILECGAHNRNPTENQAGYALYITQGTLRFGASNGARNWTEALWDDVRCQTPVTDNEWHTATGVFFGNGRDRVRLFVDGREALNTERYGQAQAAIAAYPDRDPVACIAKNTKPSVMKASPWPGSLDEIRVWNVALTPQQVRDSWDRPVAGNTPGLLALWDFDQAPYANGAGLDDRAGRCHGVAAVVTTPAVRLLPFFPVDRSVFPVDDFRYAAYPTAITGYNGQNLQRIWQLFHEPAVRTRVGDRGNYKAGLTRLPDGRLLLALCRERRDADPPRYYLHVHESTDTGRSWTEVAATDLIGKEPSLLTLPDGAVLMTAQDADFSRGHRRRPFVARSDDAGRSWQIIRRLTFGNYPRNVLLENDGSLLFLRPLPDANLQLCRSSDGGRTWTFSDVTVAWPPSERNSIWETSVVQLDDGTFVAALRRQIPDTKGEGFQDAVITRSTDNGASWSAPQPLVATAEVHANLLKLRDGRLLVSYSSYHLPYGAYAQISRDGGRTWDDEQSIRLSLSADIYVGWPVTIQLPDATLITAYAGTTYAQQPPERTTLEVVHWALPFTGAAPLTVGTDSEAAARNDALLAHYDLKKYPDAATGYNSLDRQRVEFQHALAAGRTRIGTRGDRWMRAALQRDGTLIAAVTEPRQAAAGEKAPRVELHQSADGGTTWQRAGPGPPESGRRPSLTVLADGTLLLIMERPGSDAEPPQLLAARRTPDGSEWETTLLNTGTAPTNVLTNPNRVALFAVPAEAGNLLLYRSIDSARTWTATTGAVDWPNPDRPRILGVSLARVANNELVAALHTRSSQAAAVAIGTDRTLLSRSPDTGETWTPPAPFLSPAQVDAQLLLVAENRLLVTFTNSRLPFGVQALSSRDGGRTWEDRQPLQLTRTADYRSAWPGTVHLGNRRFLTVYTATRYSREAPRDRVCEALCWELPE